MRKDLGPLWQWLPEGALDHDPNAYLAAERGHLSPGRGKSPGPSSAKDRDPKLPRGARLVEAVRAPRPQG
jgi:hypothetical protein